MKIRNIPYGYQYRNGRVTVHPQESEIISEIMSLYIGGSSLSEIADTLNVRNVEYNSGAAGWNKARLMRLIEDERYLGTETFPALIDRSTRERAIETKSRKNTQKATDRSAVIYRLGTPVICGSCGHTMRRRYDGKLKGRVRWICNEPSCAYYIDIPDEALLKQLADLLNLLVNEPLMIRCTSIEQLEPSTELRRLEHDIDRAMSTREIDENTLRKKLLEYASAKYDCINNERYITERLRAYFDQAAPLTEFSLKLFQRTVKNIMLFRDGTAGITLLNNQHIRMEG